MASDNPPKLKKIKGDIESVTRLNGEKGSTEGLFEIRVVGHPHRYQVGIDMRGGSPRLVELRLLPLDGVDAEIDTTTVRSIPVVRLAKAAAQKIGIDELPFALAGQEDAALTRLRPDYVRGRSHDEDHYRDVALLLTKARELGLSPRKYVAETMNAAIPTVDRWIKRAKELGHLERDWSNNNGHDLT
jgi:hypothetical protein